MKDSKLNSDDERKSQFKFDLILVFGMVLMALTSLVFLVAEYVD